MAIHNDLTGAGGVDAGEKLDARAAIAGKRTSDGQHLSGLFDRGSWIEAQAGWAKSVVTGRARLGGIPIGGGLDIPAGSLHNWLAGAVMQGCIAEIATTRELSGLLLWCSLANSTHATLKLSVRSHPSAINKLASACADMGPLSHSF